MKIAVVGTGYVGLVTGACFAEIGVDVTCVDVDNVKIDNLNKGIIPIYEPGLEELVVRNANAGRLSFTTSLESCIDEVEVVFSAVGTPPDEDGNADLKYVLQVAKTIGEKMNSYVLVVTKSTVPVGTAKKVRETIQKELDNRGVDIEFDKWLGFLVDQGLIAKKEETRLAAMLSSADYHITDKGVAFLTYISNRNYDKKDWGM